LIDILVNKEGNYFDIQWSMRINYLCLDLLAKITMNIEGK